MSLGSELADGIAADARLITLRELAEQIDGQLAEISLQRVLDAWSIRRDRDWVRTQMRKLEMLGAIELQPVGSMLAARITKSGRDHVAERAIIEGVSRPAEFD